MLYSILGEFVLIFELGRGGIRPQIRPQGKSLSQKKYAKLLLWDIFIPLCTNVSFLLYITLGMVYCTY